MYVETGLILLKAGLGVENAEEQFCE